MEKVKGLTKEEKSRAKEKAKDMRTEQVKVSPEEMKKLAELMEIAKMPIKLKDKDVQLAQGEVDIRGLSEDNKFQMFFKLFVLNNLYLNDVVSSLVDIMRLLMILLKKQGVEDIEKSMEDLLTELSNKIKNKQN